MDLKIKAKTLKPLKVNMGQSLSHFVQQGCFLEKTLKALNVKGKKWQIGPCQN